MKKIEIITNDGTSGNTDRRFLNKDSSQKVRCAYMDRFCNPDCAACCPRGPKFVCIRNGVDNEFEIGYID